MTRLTIICFFLCSTSYADDIFLKTGFVLRNVQVIDTTNGRINILRDARQISIDIDDVLRVEHRDFLPNQKSAYELFSSELYEQYQKSLPQKEKLASERKREREAVRTAFIADSLRQRDEHLNRVYSWQSSFYFAGAWGYPQGFRFELGYNLGMYLSLGITFGIGDAWSHERWGGTFGLLGSIRFPIDSLPVTPYLFLCTQTTISVGPFGGGPSDQYALIHLGLIVPLKPWLQLRPEIGLDFTSRYFQSGGSIFKERYSYEDKTRFGVHVGMEVDFRHVF